MGVMDGNITGMKAEHSAFILRNNKQYLVKLENYSVKKHDREIIRYLKRMGATNIDIRPGGKHPRIVFAWNGVARYYPIRCSPGNIEHSVRDTIHSIKALVKGASQL